MSWCTGTFGWAGTLYIHRGKLKATVLIKKYCTSDPNTTRHNAINVASCDFHPFRNRYKCEESRCWSESKRNRSTWLGVSWLLWSEEGLHTRSHIKILGSSDMFRGTHCDGLQLRRGQIRSPAAAAENKRWTRTTTATSYNVGSSQIAGQADPSTKATLFKRCLIRRSLAITLYCTR
jgi:hypothetical protein